MKRIIALFISISGLLSASAGSKPETILKQRKDGVYEMQIHPTCHKIEVCNRTEGGFIVKADEQIIGYGDADHFDPQTAAPAMIEWMHALACQPASSYNSNEHAFATTAVAPLLGDINWNQDAPFNNLCPQYEMGKTAPTGCVATAMAQVMYYHQWPLQGEGTHTYSPAVMNGNTLTANFGNTEYRWGMMLPRYTAASSKESGDAVAELMLHCGVATDMEYYSQSGASDTVVARAMMQYFRYDRSIAYRKREHYPTREWLKIIHDELAEGRPVLAYGRSTSGGHAYVFDGMDENGLIHVNWGWGGMSNGYFNTSALTPASQGIGGSDGGFNYSQRIITGIRPRTEGTDNDYDVELASTEGLTASKAKISQGADVTIKLSGKVMNHGWRKSTFDYAIELLDANGQQVALYEGPKGQTLDKEETAYGPSFGTINFGVLPVGSYTLRPMCRMTEGVGEWLPVRDHYIGYPNILRITATDSQIAFEAPDYFKLKATCTSMPEVIYRGVPTLIAANITNTGDVEYHGEIKVQLRNAQNSVVATTKNYIVDLQPDEVTDIRFTDAYDAPAGNYTLCLVDDDGSVISSKTTMEVKEANTMGTPYSVEQLRITNINRDTFTAEATIAANGLCGGLLYTYIYNEDNKMVGCLFPEYFIVTPDQKAVVVMKGTFENAMDGQTYRAQLAALTQDAMVSFLDDDLSSCTFVFGTGNGIESIESTLHDDMPAYNLHGQRVCRHAKGIVIINGKKQINR